MEKIRKFQSATAKVSLVLSGIMLASVGLFLFLSVVDRFITKIGMMWIDEYARYVLIWSVMLSSNVLIYRNEMMRVDFMDAFWPKRFKQVREMLYTAIFVVMLSVLIYFGWEQALAYTNANILSMPVPKFYVYASIPVGCTLMMIQYLLNLVCTFIEWKGGRKK